jgi:hypothetical protein
MLMPTAFAFYLLHLSKKYMEWGAGVLTSKDIAVFYATETRSVYGTIAALTFTFKNQTMQTKNRSRERDKEKIWL